MLSFFKKSIFISICFLRVSIKFRSIHSLKNKILVRLSCKIPLLDVKTMYSVVLYFYRLVLHFCMEMVYHYHLFIRYLITTRLLHSRACATVARK